MGHRIEKWVADDGTEWPTKHEMMKHELLVLDEKLIDIFIDDVLDTHPRKKPEYKRILVQWQEYSRRGEQAPTPVQEVVVDESQHVSEEWKPNPGRFTQDNININEAGDFVYSPEEEERQIAESLK